MFDPDGTQQTGSLMQAHYVPITDYTAPDKQLSDQIKNAHRGRWTSLYWKFELFKRKILFGFETIM